MDDIKLELRNVAAGYGDKIILKNVNCIINSGEICCLLGPNGVGKTTLFKTILGLIPPVSGQVLMDGSDTADWSARQLADNIAYVSQFHNPPFPYKVKDVVLLGRVSQAGYFGKVSEMDYEIAQQAIIDMGVAHLAEKPYTDISGGERQLVMIARALTQQPKWLMMDEPTASLDYGNMIRVISRIVELRDRGYGIIMTTHLPDQAFMCDAKAGLLQRGSSMKFGDAAEIITEENMKETYGVGVSVAEFFDRRGHLMRMCVPEIGSDSSSENTFTDQTRSGKKADIPAPSYRENAPAGQQDALFRKTPADQQDVFSRSSSALQQEPSVQNASAGQQDALFRRTPADQQDAFSRSSSALQQEPSVRNTSAGQQDALFRRTPAEKLNAASRSAAIQEQDRKRPAVTTGSSSEELLRNAETGSGRPAADLMKNRRQAPPSRNRRNGFRRSGKRQEGRQPSTENFHKGNHHHGRKGPENTHSFPSGHGQEGGRLPSRPRPLREDQRAGYMGAPPPSLHESSIPLDQDFLREQDRAPAQDAFSRRPEPQASSLQTPSGTDRWRTPADDYPHQDRPGAQAGQEQDRDRTRRRRPNALKGS